VSVAASPSEFQYEAAMSTVEVPPREEAPAEVFAPLPDHTQLPDKDPSVMETFLELPQALLLTSCLLPVLQRVYPDGRYAIGGNSGIYWNVTDPPVKGAICPDWFLVPGVDPLLVAGVRRRSYVLWKEHIPPLIVLECVSGDGTEEHDHTPEQGKLWIYENPVAAGFYGIFDPEPGRVELYQRVGARFRPVPANEHGHFPVEDLGVALGVWRGRFQEIEQPWLRWFDAEGRMLLTGEERAERLAAQLRALGVEPEA
jgi:Uma2 family endonuclease